MNEFEKYYGSESSIMDKEEFRPVVENSRYEVSNYGHVRKSDTWVWLTESLERTGYRRVSLAFDNGRRITYAVHRLVAHAFYPMENADEFQVNHIDGDKMNNHLDNLEYVTSSENARHAFATGLSKMTDEYKKKHRDVIRAFYPPVKCLENGKVYPDAHVAAKDLGLDPSSIRAVTRGEQETHKGYHFENVDWSEINVYDD